MNRAFPVLAALVFSACSSEPEEAIPTSNATRLLVITLDTVRADHLGAYGDARAITPVLDRLAREGVSWQSAEAAAPLTLPSHATMFTGLYPYQHGVRNNGFYHLEDRFTTLAELLRDAGFDTAAFVGGFPLVAKFGLNQGFASYEDRLDRDAEGAFAHGERPASEVADAFLRWHETRKATGRWFAWVHFYDAHAEYEPPEPFRAASEGRLYDGEIAFVDSTIGRILTRLEQSGELDDTVVLTVADHGESLGEHGEATHSVFVYGATVHVPLILWHRSLAVRDQIVESLVRTADVFPTVLELCRVAKPDALSLSGESLLPTFLHPGKTPARTSYSESLLPLIQFGWGELRSLRQGNRRYVRSVKPELYDLSADPAERVNLYGGSEEAARLEEDLTELLAADAESTSGEHGQLSASEIETLESLGYVMARPVPGAQPAEVPDAKDRIEIYERLQKGLQLASKKHLAEAAAELESAIAADPTNVYGKKRLAEVYHQLGRSTEAIAMLEGLVKGSVIDSELLATLGRIRRDQGDLEGAARDLKAANDLNPRYSSARFELAAVQLRLGHAEVARDLLESVLAEEPMYAPAQVEMGNVMLALQKPAEALAHFAKAIELDSKLPAAWISQGKALSMAGRLDEAQTSLEKALSLGAADRVVKNELAHVLYLKGSQAAGANDLEGALKWFREAEAVAPDDAKIQQDLGVVCSRLGRLPEAIAYLEKARDLAPESPVIQNSLGAAYGRSGDLARARQAFEEAVRLDPGYTSARQNLAGVLEALGLPEEAQKQAALASAGESHP